MIHQVIQTFLNEWTRADTMRLIVEFTPLFLPIAIWGAVPPLRKRGEALLVLFGLFTGLHALFSACTLVFGWPVTAARLAWPASPFVIKLGFSHAAFGIGLLICLGLRKADWTKGLLIAMCLYAAASATIHLVEAFGRGRIEMAHLGPPVMHDILFFFLVFWVLRRAQEPGRAVYYVPH
jgi:hypothetical protein